MRLNNMLHAIITEGTHATQKLLQQDDPMTDTPILTKAAEAIHHIAATASDKSNEFISDRRAEFVHDVENALRQERERFICQLHALTKQLCFTGIVIAVILGVSMLIAAFIIG